MAAGNVLVVDDDQGILDIVGLILEEEGYRVRLLARAEQTFETIADFHPDLIILDVMLGDLDGRDICNSLKKTTDTHNIPVIMISATHDMEQFLASSCVPDDFIAKPFDIVNLIGKVRHNLSTT